MEQWRSEVIKVEKPKKRRRTLGTRLAGLAKDILITASVAAVLAGALSAGLVVGYTPGNALSEPTDVVEGVVVTDSAHTDTAGTTRHLNPLLEAFGLAPVESLQPYLDTYQVFVLQEGGSIVPVEFLEWSVGAPSQLEELANTVGPGMRVRIPLTRGLTRHYGHSLDILGQDELPGPAQGLELSFEPSSPAEGFHLGFLGLFDSAAPDRLKDNYLVWRYRDDPLLADPGALADSLFGRLSGVDMTTCPGTSADDVYRLGHADLIRLSLLMDHVGSIRNRRELALMMSEDMLDHTAEHGGWVRLSGEGLDFHEVASTLSYPDDRRYDFNAYSFFTSPQSVALFHFHAQQANIENACPSGMEWGEGGDLDLVREMRIPGVVLSSLAERRFNATFYTKDAAGEGEVVINLGSYSYGSDADE